MIKKKIKIVIADDNLFFCEALKESLEKQREFEVVQIITNLEDLCDFTHSKTFDILILDINFQGKNALEYIDSIRKPPVSFKIITLTTLNNPYIRDLALSKGVDCFVGKDGNWKLFKNKILECYYAEKKADTSSKNKFKINNQIITRRKIQILQALYDFADKTEAEIARKLFISKTTLKNHKTELFEITGTKNTPALIRFAIKNGLILV